MNPSCAVNETLTDLGCIPNDPIGFAAKFYGIGLGMIGGVALIFIICGGYLFISSGGNPQQIQKAKIYLFYAIIGLVMAILGFVIIQIVFVNILKIPGFK